MNGFTELFYASIEVVNLPYTLLLLLIVLYWVSVMFGVLDMSSLDVDFGELEGAPDGADVASSAGAMDGFLEYLNLRKVPVSIVMSFFALSLWMVGVAVNQGLHHSQSLILGLAVFAGNVIFSAHIAKWMSRPLVPLFSNMRLYVSSNRELTGSRVIITSSTADVSFGEAEIGGEGSPITLMVRTEGEVLNRGAEAVILGKESEKDVYIITKLEMEI